MAKRNSQRTKTIEKKKNNTKAKGKGKTSSLSRESRRKTKTTTSVWRKLDLKKRSKQVREWQAHMEAARLECKRLGIGAVKYLSPKNDIAQLPDCPLTMSDKTRLAHNLKIGRTPRKGEHVQHLTDAEELDVSIEMNKAAHARQPLTWAAVGELVAETISNRPNGPDGRVFTKPAKQGKQCARKGKCGFRWRHSFAGRTDMKDFEAEDLGQSRARACNEFAMHEHLTDLRAELIDTGIMSEEDSSISDPRRIINMDEIPSLAFC